jgi:serine/threonine protein kinase
MHRDIKPANILLTSAFSAINNYKGVKVADFGLAEQSKRAVTLSGSWRYVAPEILQCDGKGYDRKVDIWSLGCTMYELCERKCLFPEKGEALKNAILGAKKAPQVRSYSAELNFLLKQCLQYDSVDRCSSLDLLNSLGVRFWHYSNDQSENLNAKAIEVRIKQEIQTAQIDKLNRELHEQRTELQKIYDLQADIKRIRDELKQLSHIK